MHGALDLYNWYEEFYKNMGKYEHAKINFTVATGIAVA